jgi:transposase
MTDHKRLYRSEFKTQAISLVRDAKRPAIEVAKELGINKSTLYNWLSLSGASKSSKPDQASVAEIKRLKKALAQAELERDILKKAAAYFAKETL